MGRRVDIAKAMWSAVRGTPPSFPDDEGWQALAAGNLDRAEAVAQELLDGTAGMADERPEGDRQHMAHTLRGYVCLRRGDVDGAAAALIRSAQVEATPVWSWRGSADSVLGLM